MIVIGVDVHKQSLLRPLWTRRAGCWPSERCAATRTGCSPGRVRSTAVAVDELGRELARWSGPPEAALLGWARSLAGKRLWALEDCRHVSRGLEALLLGAGERLVRVPPRLTARPSVGAGACAALRMRSTRSPSPAPPCASRASIGPGPESRACGS